MYIKSQMMKKLISFSLVIMFATSMTTVHSQVITRLINKGTQAARKKTEKKLENEVEKGVEKKFSKLLGIEVDSAGMVNTKPVYEFDGLIEMTIINSEKDDPVDKSTYTTFIDSKSFDYGMSFNEPEGTDQSLIIFDAENDLMLTLSESDGEKTGFAMGFSPEQTAAIAGEMEDEEDEESETSEEKFEDPYSTYKTGKTKKILGYKCDEYRIENEEEDVVTMWITQDLTGDIKKSYLTNSTFTGLYMYAYATKGMVMEYILEDLADKTRTVMTVTEIDLNRKNSINTGEYNIMNMSGMMPEAVESTEQAEE